MNVSEVLNRAADLIEERGWARGAGAMKIGGPHCALGSIAAAAGTEEFPRMGIYHHWAAEVHPAGEAFSAHIGGEEIPYWNDTHTATEVVEALRAAALIAAASEVEARLLEGPRATPPTAAPAVVDTAGARL